MPEEEIKKRFKEKAQQEPEKHYPVRVLLEEGFSRRLCKCGNYFWAFGEREVCGEPDCEGGYTFIGDTPARAKMDYIQTWQKFAKLFKKLGYTPIPRYPVVARWRDDAEFVQASIYDFQPYCVTGEVDPPANPLVVPQFCLRFNDVDNVGITGRHYTGFVMIGQHAFEAAEKYKPEDYLEHIYLWLTKGMKIPKEELQFHEDAWAGGGNMGPSIEYFSRGLEIGNQVYMQYDIKTGVPKELSIKVLDMGMGQERPPWLTCGAGTSYEAVFPTVLKRLYSITGEKKDAKLMRSFMPYSSLSAEKLDTAWDRISESIGVEVKDLKEHILSLSGIYSLCDHSRSLLLALSDGAIPSNAGGGYNLRSLARRCFDFIAKYEWEVNLPELCKLHARYLRKQYPELIENLEEVEEILEAEQKKYTETKEKSRRIISSLRGKEVTIEKLIELYDSNGITPEVLRMNGLDIKAPPDFYIKVAERHGKQEQKAQEHEELDLKDMPRTEILYYDYALVNFKARVLKLIDGYVILDRTAFYPTSGGQLHDLGKIEGCSVEEVFKQGNVIVHKVRNPAFEEGNEVSCSIDWERRKQLAQLHTATHIINGAARKLLGEHIWQAGAEKTTEKARLDITHYASLSAEELQKVEDEANEVVSKDLPVESGIYRRNAAEAEFGFRLYQGGAVPGKELRVVKIGSLDVEACGGTHLKRTSETGFIKILGSHKIQDGVVRLEYVAGKAAEEYKKRVLATYEKLSSSIAELGFEVSKVKTASQVANELNKSAEALSVPVEQLEDAVAKFKREIIARGKEIGRLQKLLNRSGEVKRSEKPVTLSEASERMFKTWKEEKRQLENLKEELAKRYTEKVTGVKIKGYELICEEIEADGEGTQKIAQQLLATDKNKIVVLFGVGERISVVGLCHADTPINLGKIIFEACKILGGGGGGRREFARGAGVKKDRLKEAVAWVKEHIEKELGSVWRT